MLFSSFEWGLNRWAGKKFKFGIERGELGELWSHRGCGGARETIMSCFAGATIARGSCC